MESYTIRGLRVSIADRLEINDLNDDLRSIWRRRIERWVWQHGGDSIWGHWSLHFSLSISISLDWKALSSERKRRAKGFCKGGERVERELLSFWLITPRELFFFDFLFLKTTTAFGASPSVVTFGMKRMVWHLFFFFWSKWFKTCV